MFDDSFKTRYTTIPFAVYYGDYSNVPRANDSFVFRHQHAEVEILTVSAGEAVFYIGNNSYSLTAGDVAIVSPYMLHSYKIFADKPFKHYCICFNIDLLSDKGLSSKSENDRIEIQPLIPHTDKNAQLLSEYAQNAYYACRDKKDGWELFAIGNMMLFFGILKSENKIKGSLKTGSDFCRDIFDYISTNYPYSITSKDAAKALFLSNSYFCRIFKENFGYCFQDYLAMYRTEKSKTLLRTTSKSISQISAETGFNSFSYYNKIFKKYNSCTPMEYRKNRL